MADLENFSGEARNVIETIGTPVNKDDIDVFGKYRGIVDRSHRLRTILDTWKEQQDEDRKLRSNYAFWLMLFMGLQTVAINVIYVLMGCSVLKFDEWTARTFIMGVFAEIAALVLIVVTYLFRKPDADLFQLLKDESKSDEQH